MRNIIVSEGFRTYSIYLKPDVICSILEETGFEHPITFVFEQETFNLECFFYDGLPLSEEHAAKLMHFCEDKLEEIYGT